MSYKVHNTIEASTASYISIDQFIYSQYEDHSMPFEIVDMY